MCKQSLGIVVGFVWPQDREPSYQLIEAACGAKYRQTSTLPHHVLVRFVGNIDRSALNVEWQGIANDGDIVPVPCGSFQSTVNLKDRKVSVAITTIPLAPAFALGVCRVQGATFGYIDLLDLAGATLKYYILSYLLW